MRKEIQAIMWKHCGIVRSMEGLKTGLEKLKKYDATADFEFRNFLESAKLVIKSALKRKESRGLQCLTDYPEKNPKLLKHYTMKKI
jgi:L-aspartate oxidase